MKKFFLAACVAVVSAFSMNAQGIHFRAEVGGNFTNIDSKIKDKKFDTNMLAGLRAGLGVELKFAPMVYAATGLNYRMGGSKNSLEILGKVIKEDVFEVRNHSISLPINLGLRAKFGAFGVSAEAGPYLAYTLSSTQTNNITKELQDSYAFLKDLEDKTDLLEYRNRFEAGVGASIAAEYSNFYLRLGTTWGLTNMMKDNKDDISKALNGLFKTMPDNLKNHEFYLNLGIRF